jgi:TatD DNase family protein
VASESTIEIVDTHCHLNFDVFDNDRSQVVQRARENGIIRILIPAIDIETSKSALKYAWEFPEIYASVGLHPNQGLSWTKGTISELWKLAAEKKVVAIGEIGLDYYRDRTPIGLQQYIFEEQLELAKELGLPVIIHNREASDDIFKIIKKWHDDLSITSIKLADRPGVMHSFSGDEPFANKMTSLNFKIGVSGPVTFKKNMVLQSVVASLPIESIFIETDSPYLTPHPFRGMRNEPANVRIVAEKVADLKDETLDTIAKITTTEAETLFRWREIL